MLTKADGKNYLTPQDAAQWSAPATSRKKNNAGDVRVFFLYF